MRTPAKPSTRFGRSGDFSVSICWRIRVHRTHAHGEETDIQSTLCHGSLDYLARLQPFSLCQYLLITTHLACHCQMHGSGSGTGELYLRTISLDARCCPNRGLRARLESAWLPAGIAGVRLSYSHGAPQAERSTLQSVAVKRVRASVSRLPFPESQRDPPRKSLSLTAWLLLARSARLPATDSATAEMSIPTIP